MLNQSAPIGFRLRTLVRKSLLARWVYKRRWNRSADVMLISFPKAGRTWLRVMLSKSICLHCGIDSENRLPDLKELSQTVSTLPRIKPKHDDKPQLKTSGELVNVKTEYAGVKVVLLIRDLRDLAVSTYFQMTRREKRFTGSLGEFIRCHRGSVETMIRFYNIWADRYQDPLDFLLVRYEDLHADTKGELKRVVEFAGIHNMADSILSDAVDFARFDNLKQIEKKGRITAKRLGWTDKNDPESAKVRKGKIGGYADYLDAADIQWVTERMEQDLSPFFGYRN